MARTVIARLVTAVVLVPLISFSLVVAWPLYLIVFGIVALTKATQAR